MILLIYQLTYCKKKSRISLANEPSTVCEGMYTKHTSGHIYTLGCELCALPEAIFSQYVKKSRLQMITETLHR